jgi:hypothetical protein
MLEALLGKRRPSQVLNQPLTLEHLVVARR